MTGKYYGLYVIYQDGTQELIGNKMRLENLDEITTSTVTNKGELIFSLKAIFPHLQNKRIKDVQIQYQSRGKTKHLEVLYWGEQHELNMDYLFSLALANIDHPYFQSKIVKPYDDGKQYPLAILAREIIYFSKNHLVDSEDYQSFYNAKIQFLQTYLTNRNHSDRNYLHARRVLEVLHKINLEQNYSYETSSFHVPPFQQRLATLHHALGGKSCPKEETEVEIDDAEYSLFHDSSLSKEMMAYAQSRFEELPKDLQLRYSTDEVKNV